MPTLMKIVKTASIEVPGLGERIKQARKGDSRSLKEIAEAAGMTPANWHRIESEEQALPLDTFRKMEEVLDKDFGVEFD